MLFVTEGQGHKEPSPVLPVSISARYASDIDLGNGLKLNYSIEATIGEGDINLNLIDFANGQIDLLSSISASSIYKNMSYTTSVDSVSIAFAMDLNEHNSVTASIGINADMSINTELSLKANFGKGESITTSIGLEQSIPKVNSLISAKQYMEQLRYQTVAVAFSLVMAGVAIYSSGAAIGYVLTDPGTWALIGEAGRQIIQSSNSMGGGQNFIPIPAKI